MKRVRNSSRLHLCQTRGYLLTFPAAEYQRPLACAKLYCLLTGAHGREPAQRHYAATSRPEIEPATIMRWLQLRFEFDSTAIRLIIK